MRQYGEMNRDSLDLLQTCSTWQAMCPGEQTLNLSCTPAASGPVLRLDYDFKGSGGFVVARHVLRRPMPESYAVRFRLRVVGATNDFELKLVDPSNRNVWRHVRKSVPPGRWQRVEISSRDIDYAWGPAGGGAISELGAIEFGIVASDGGCGTLLIRALEIVDLTFQGQVEGLASSAEPGFGADSALTSGWKPRADDVKPWLQLDATEARAFGGVVIDWLTAAPARGFTVLASNTGRRWRKLYATTRAGGTRSYLYLPNTKARRLRLVCNGACGGAVLRLQPFEFSRSIEAFWHAIAQAEPRGWHPRWLSREQSLWTPIGTANGFRCALMNEEGAVEVDEGAFTIEPMLWLAGRLYVWADVQREAALREAWRPEPTVIWQAEGWRLLTTAEATVSGTLRVRYRLENLGGAPLSARLFVTIRPFQVTPPWQHFRDLGGVRRIHDIAWRDGVVAVNGHACIVPIGAIAGFGAQGFAEGLLPAQLSSGELPPSGQVHDPFGFASGALRFDLTAAAGASAEAAVAYLADDVPRALDEPAFDWAAKLPVGQWRGSGSAAPAIAALMTATAHVLIARAGPALQAGPRRYTRSWIRDSAMMAAALLRMGCQDEVRDFIRWYAPFQRADGFVPCCVDRDGPDWLVEHDSHGELIALIADYYRFTGDYPLLETLWPHVQRAVACLENLLEPSGLLPISASHEGYLAQPVHSYWDDFWALRGLRDAAYLAGALGNTETQQRWQTLAAHFGRGVFASITALCAKAKIDYVPGSVEWADFDPTATANGVALLDGMPELDRRLVVHSFDAFIEDWRRMHRGERDWSNYTAYQIRIIGAFVRLGRRESALELLEFFLTDRRPRAWNQWPEITWRDPLAPGHIGDVPHCWIGAEYVLAVRSLFVYEDDSEQALVLAAGVALAWCEGEGVQVTLAPTAFGTLSYTLRRIDAETLQFDVAGGITASRIVLRPPLAGAMLRVVIDGVVVQHHEHHTVTLTQWPARVTITTERAA